MGKPNQAKIDGIFEAAEYLDKQAESMLKVKDIMQANPTLKYAWNMVYDALIALAIEIRTLARKYTE